jgi:hypothetical protein
LACTAGVQRHPLQPPKASQKKRTNLCATSLRSFPSLRREVAHKKPAQTPTHQPTLPPTHPPPHPPHPPTNPHTNPSPPPMRQRRGASERMGVGAQRGASEGMRCINSTARRRSRWRSLLLPCSATRLPASCSRALSTSPVAGAPPYPPYRASSTPSHPPTLATETPPAAAPYPHKQPTDASTPPASHHTTREHPRTCEISPQPHSGSGKLPVTSATIHARKNLHVVAPQGAHCRDDRHTLTGQPTSASLRSLATAPSWTQW